MQNGEAATQRNLTLDAIDDLFSFAFLFLQVVFFSPRMSLLCCLIQQFLGLGNLKMGRGAFFIWALVGKYLPARYHFSGGDGSVYGRQVAWFLRARILPNSL
jgi:hypothetical protein